MEVVSFDNKGPMGPGSEIQTSHIAYHNSNIGLQYENFVSDPSTAFGSIPLYQAPISVPVAEESPKEPRRFKLSRHQTVTLENLYKNNSKPNQNTKREVAEEIQLSVTRVNIWFQNRRHRAKVSKKAEEAKMAQIFEAARQDRLAKMAVGPVQSPTKANGLEIDSEPQPSLELLSTEFNPNENSTPRYASNKEAAAASIARTKAAIQAAHEYSLRQTEEVVSEFHPGLGPFDGTPPANYSLDPYDGNFYPVSTFSDWSSGYSSVAYTPTPAGQMEDPFEYDKLSSLHPSYSNMQPNLAHLPPVFHDDYSAFAAACQMNSGHKAVNMTLKSRVPVPAALVLKGNSATQRPMLPRVATCPDLSNAPGFPPQNGPRHMHTVSEASSPVTDQSPRFPSALPMERSQSYSDKPSLQQEMALRRIMPAPSHSRSNSRTNQIFQGKVAVHQSPLRAGQTQDNEGFIKPENPRDAIAPLLTPPGDSDTAVSTVKLHINGKVSDLSKGQSPIADVPDLESDSGLTAEETPSRPNFVSPPPTPQVINGVQTGQGASKYDGQDQQFTTFTQMLDQESPVAAPGFLPEDFQPNVQNWINMSNHPQGYPNTYYIAANTNQPFNQQPGVFEYSH